MFSFCTSSLGMPPKKKKKLADKILPQKVRDMVPESRAYMDLLSFERKLDATIMRKRLDIQVSFCCETQFFQFWVSPGRTVCDG